MRGAPIGLDAELRAIRNELSRRPVAKWVQEARRRFEKLSNRRRNAGSWCSEAELRHDVADRIPEFSRTWRPPLEPPPLSAGVENLPLFFDPAHGRVAIAGANDVWELLKVSEDGTPPTKLGEFPRPDRLVELSRAGRSLLESYLNYVLERDHFLWAMYQELDGRSVPSTLVNRTKERLSEIAGTVVGRAFIRGTLAGEPPGPMDRAAVADGIRATDAEVMDTPTLGRVL